MRSELFIIREKSYKAKGAAAYKCAAAPFYLFRMILY